MLTRTRRERKCTLEMYKCVVMYACQFTIRRSQTLGKHLT
ncbi:hypothetical protein Taro_038475 [Colocasia esculenta]|uniref:Uncharacterized protein n=1 Tax=Colocasia esculenta TaxID=4460 RepID=A0A843WFY8_COLES|nr:hypothetical protein [Colocasia esculenta]